MTHQENYNLSTSTVEEMTRNGLEALPELVRVILNSVMQAERSKYLQADAYERTEERKGHANGYKPKTVRTKLGEITFAIPQVREGGFYPSALEKGMRSERALLIALAAISVQKVCQPQGSKPPRKNCVVLRYQSCKLVKQSSSWVTPLYEDKFQSNTIKPVLSSSIRILAQIQELRK